LGSSDINYCTHNRKHNDGDDEMIKDLIAAELLSDDVRDEVIDGWNKSVDIPLLSEKVERKIMLAIWSIVKASLLKKL
tara:strand:+ start:392 stop:625 length:234 start_codon:yes stop_codon:yes gene_type:complete